MNVHEYQAKQLLASYGLHVPRSGVAYTATQAALVAEEIGGQRWVVKAQIHAGGRGKAGGVQIARSLPELKEIADRMIGTRLVTAADRPRGRLSSACSWRREPDRQGALPRAGDRPGLAADRRARLRGRRGRDRGHRRADARCIVRERVDPAVGLQDFQCRKVATAIGIPAPLLGQAVRLMKSFTRCFRDKDALQAEINPLVITEDGDLVALDAKMIFDDNALYRRADIVELRDFDEEDPKEADASGHGINYIALDGRSAASSTGPAWPWPPWTQSLLHGGRPANFLDVGGGATPEKVANAFRIVLRDPSVKAILVNISPASTAAT